MLRWLINHIVGELHLAPEHDGGEDGEGDEEHRAVAANLLAAPNLWPNSIGLERMVFGNGKVVCLIPGSLEYKRVLIAIWGYVEVKHKLGVKHNQCLTNAYA